jgi:DNA replication and repair protein RecF
VHLDPARRQAMFDALTRLPGPALLSGTDAATFLPLAQAAEGLRTGDGRLTADSRFLPPSDAFAPVPGTL